MKREIFEVVYGEVDTDSAYFDDYKAAKGFAIGYIYHLTEKEQKTHQCYILGHSITLPEEYEYTTPKALAFDLFNGDVEVPEFDVCFGFKDDFQTIYEKIL